ncbi:hypothetical protein [Streptococcus sp. S784/96/1]|uniref:hypothetical protein n=1 Tax=Streptococcus sp. S784/96/1 TaxID=2653499 RepID=UPI0013876593|nr:hypothetical protein [Streptococcus sp. S784/96/1]
MIEKIKQESLNTLTDLFLTGLEEGQPKPVVTEGRVSKKYTLQLLRSHQQNIKEVLPEAYAECKVAYQELSQLSDEAFAILYQELLTIKS